ncbi:MAG: hypothetical protein ACXW1T_09960 [Methylophilus sp.]
MELEKNLKLFMYSLLSIEILLVIAYLLTKFLLPQHEIEFFDLDKESNLGAWFSSSQLLLIGFVCLSIHFICRKTDNNYPKPIFLIGFFIFVFLSCDEATSIHEKVHHLFLNRLHFHVTHFRDDQGQWILPYILIMLSILFILKNSFIQLWKKHQSALKLAISGGLVFLLGATVLEIIGYQYLKDGHHIKLYYIEVAFEEFFEMLGATIMLVAAGKILLKSLPARTLS